MHDTDIQVDSFCDTFLIEHFQLHGGARTFYLSKYFIIIYFTERMRFNHQEKKKEI